MRRLPFRGGLLIEADDYMDAPPKDYFRLSPGAMVRLRNAYVIRCDEVVRDAAGRAVELRCSHFPETLGGKPLASGVKVKGIIHWVAEQDAVPCEVRLYDRLFTAAVPGEGQPDGDVRPHLNPEGLVVLERAVVEPALAGAAPEARFQFERLGYFVADRYDCVPGRLVFNRTVSLKDTWAKIAGKG
jgi:glutaminyl-tRNA synthetase